MFIGRYRNKKIIIIISLDNIDEVNLKYTIEILFEQVFEDFDIGDEIFKYNLLVDTSIVNNLVA